MNATLRKPTAPEAAPNALPEAGEAIPYSAMPSADDYAASAQTRARWLMLGGALLAGAAAGSFVAFGLDNLIVPIVLLLAVVTPILLWRYPRLSLYSVLAAACLFELGLVASPDGSPFRDALTDRVPFFWNVNTIFQVYAHSNFKGVPLSLFEIFILVAGVCSTLRAVYTQNTNLRAGPLLLPIAVYVAFVALGWANGIGTGGDFKISLQEVRSQFYFALAYLMAVNVVRDRKIVVTLLWITVVCIGLKGVLLTFRRYVTLHGLPLPDQGVGMHEEAFFFNAFVLLLLVLTLCRILPRLRWLMWSLLPFVALGNLALNRRTATAAMIVLLPLLIMAAYQALPERRRVILGLSAAVIAGLAIYYPLFKNSDSIFAQPARAIRSNFQPDARDASSNASRDAENANLMATIHSAPLQGRGYGLPYLHVVPMDDITSIYPLEDFMPHNQILWVWERVGTFGFLAFWMMISAILVFAGQTIRMPDADGMTKALGMIGLLVTAMLIVFGLLDLQLSNFRDVLFAGLWVGVLGAAPGMNPPPPARQARLRP